MSANIGANASDVGLVVQGTLIFLSACVGILGFMVQARLNRKAERRRRQEERDERAHDMKLQNIKEKLSLFIGPASALALAGTRAGITFKNVAEKFYPDEIKRYRQAQEERGETMANYWKATWSNMYTLVGKEVEAKMIDDPQCQFAKIYRNLFMAEMKNSWGPLRDLLCKYSGHLMDWQTPDEFKKRWPCGEPGILRNTFFTRMISFANEGEMMIEQFWKKGDFSIVFPVLNPYPAQISMYLLTMAGRVRQRMVDAGIGTHKTMSDEEEKKRLLSEASKRFQDEDSTRTTRYIKK